MSSGHRNRSPSGFGASTQAIHRCGSHTKRSTDASTYRHGKYSTALHFTNCVPIDRYVDHAGRNAPTVVGGYEIWSRSIFEELRQTIVVSPGTWRVTSCSESARQRSRRW